MRLALVAACLVGCSAPVTKAQLTPPVEPTPVPITSFEQALPLLCAAYAQEKLPCADTLTFGYPRQPDDVLSGVDIELHTIHMQPLPAGGQGSAYWANWSAILSEGAWQPTFASDADARELATTLLVSVLAHELGHHIAEDHGCNVPGMAGELLADDLSVDLVRPLLPRHDDMRRVADAMIAAVPGHEPVPADLDGWASAIELPFETPIYAAAHLDRQRRVLADPTRGPRAREACRRRHAERLAQRIVIPTRVESARTIERRNMELAFDRAGQVWRAEDDGNTVSLFFEDESTPRVVVTIPGKFLGANRLAVVDAERFAIHDRLETWIVEHGVATAHGGPSEAKLAFDEAGTLYQAANLDGVWTVAPVGGAPRWTLKVYLEKAHWGDGPLASADGWPEHFAVRGDRVVFFDRGLHAVRAIDGQRVVTLAGSLPGQHDGPGSEARFFHASALGIDAQGRIHLIGWNGQERVVTP